MRSNCYAADFIPIRLVISIAIIGAIVVLVFFGYKTMSISLDEGQVEQSCKQLESKLYSMISSGEPRDVDETNSGDGTMRIHLFNLPDSLIFLGIGIDPDPGNNGSLKTGLTDDGNVIFYKVSGGSKRSIWLDTSFKFREGNFDGGKWSINKDEQGYIIKKGGITSLKFELVEKNGENFVLILANDGINI